VTDLTGFAQWEQLTANPWWAELDYLPAGLFEPATFLGKIVLLCKADLTDRKALFHNEFDKINIFGRKRFPPRVNPRLPTPSPFQTPFVRSRLLRAAPL
jgi:hypothetical protein